MPSLLHLAFPRGITLALFLGALATACAKDPVVHYDKPEDLQSPDKHYAITVPVCTDAMLESGLDGENSVVKRDTGKILSVIKQEEPAYNRTLNHHGTGEASWSADSSLLLWTVDGKWFFDSLVLMKIDKEENKVEWQLDLMKAGQQAILKRTKKAAPKRYAAAKEENKGNGSAYPEGFTVNVNAITKNDQSLALPLTIHVELTTDPRIDGELEGNLSSHLDAIVTKDGVFTVTDFKLGKRP